MKKIKTDAIITPLNQTQVAPTETDLLILDEKHFKFGFLNVAYSNIQQAKIESEGPLLFKQYYLVVSDEQRRYKFGPFVSKGFLKKLPLPFENDR